MTLSLILPCYNEESSVDSVLSNVLNWKNEALSSQSQLSEVEIIVVDDGSTDNSVARISQYSDVTLVKHSTNLGYGAALQTGIKNAKNDWLCFFDFDDTCKPEDIIPLLNTAIENSPHHVIGNRLNPNTQMPAVRKLGNTLYRTLCLLLFRKGLYDVCSGYRVFSKERAQTFLDLPKGLNFSLAMSLLGFSSPEGLKQVDIQYKERSGASKLNAFNHGVEFLLTILKYAAIKRF